MSQPVSAPPRKVCPRALAVAIRRRLVTIAPEIDRFLDDRGSAATSRFFAGAPFKDCLRLSRLWRAAAAAGFDPGELRGEMDATEFQLAELVVSMFADVASAEACPAASVGELLDAERAVPAEFVVMGI